MITGSKINRHLDYGSSIARSCHFVRADGTMNHPVNRFAALAEIRHSLFICRKRMSWLKAIVAGALVWVAMYLIATAFQPAHAGSVIATIEIGLALIVAIIGCLLLRW